MYEECFLIIINKLSLLTFAMHFFYNSSLAIMAPLHWLPCCTLSQFIITMFKKSSVIGWNISSPGDKKQKQQLIQRKYMLIRSRCHGTLHC